MASRALRNLLIDDAKQATPRLREGLTFAVTLGDAHGAHEGRRGTHISH